MYRAMLCLGLVLPLAACGSKPSVEETNASVEEVSQKVREASRDQGLIRPGKWISTVTIENMAMPGMPPETRQRLQSMLQQTRTAEVCLTEEQAKKPSADFFSGNEECRYDHFTMTGGKIDAAMRCSHGGTTQTMQMAGTYSPTSYEMRMKSATAGGPSGEPMTMEMRVQSHRVGDCTPQQG